MPYFFVINPSAGRRVGDARALVDSVFSGKDIKYEVEYTRARGHASELAARALLRGFDKIVAVGGDGTIRETAASLVGKEAALGIVPCGSGNGLARNLYIPLSPAKAAAGLLSWEPRLIDSGLVNGQPFFCASGAGLDAEVAHDFNSLTKRRGILPYVWHAAKRVLAFKPREVLVRVDGAEHRVTALLTAVLNGVQYGGGARIAPGAYIDDGRLDFCAVKPAPLYRLAAAVPALFSGRLADHPEIYSTLRGQVIELDCGGPAWYHLDGEDFHSESGLIKISVVPASLKVLAPRPC